MKWAITAAKWAAAILGAISVFLLAYAIITLWPASDRWLYARGLEKLEKYIGDTGLKPTSDLRLCGFLPADDEPLISKHFVCQVYLQEGTLHFDVAFTSNGGIEYTDGEVAKP